MTELETEILFLRQAITAQRIAAQLTPAPAGMCKSWRPLEQLVPSGNGHRATLREIGIASCPLAPERKLTTRGKRSQEGIVAKQISANEAEIARLKAELGLR